MKSKVFNKAIEHILDLEGGFVNDPADSGGATNWGITLGFYQSHVDPDAGPQDIRDLKRERAKELYRRFFWIPHDYAVEGYHYGDLPDRIAWLCLSFSINMGPRRCHKLLQNALVKLGAEIDVDGWLGPSTIAATRSSRNIEVVKRFAVEALLFYRSIAENDSSQERFIEGWFYRGISEAVESTRNV